MTVAVLELMLYYCGLLFLICGVIPVMFAAFQENLGSGHLLLNNSLRWVGVSSDFVATEEVERMGAQSS